MTVHVIEGERDFYEKYTNHLKEQTGLKVTIHGIPDEDKTQIEDALQELFAAEVINLEHEKLRAQGVSDELLLNARRNLRPALRKLPLPENDHKILEEKVRRLARQMRPSPKVEGPDPGTTEPPPATQLPEQHFLEPIVQASHALQFPDVLHEDEVHEGPIDHGGHDHGGHDHGGHDHGGRDDHTTHGEPGTHGTITNNSCICMATGIPSVETLPMAHLRPPGYYPYVIAVFLRSGDALRLTVSDPSYLSSDRMSVSLVTEKDVGWAKEITAWNLCQGALYAIRQERPSSNPRVMGLKKGCNGADTIILRKPGLFGIWADLANMDFRLFWEVFGGKSLHFDWIYDPIMWD